MKKTFEKSLFGKIKANRKLVLLTADDDSAELKEIYNTLPDQSLRMGISECNLIGTAVGLAKMNFVPVVYTFASFLSARDLEFIRDDICVNNYNVKLVGYASGVKNNNYGPTHHTTEDISILRAIPNLTFLCPASMKEVAPVVDAAIEHRGPVYIRLGKAFETEIFDTEPTFKIGKSYSVRDGKDVSIFATGNIISSVLDAACALAKEGIEAEVVNLSSIKPLDVKTVAASIQKTRRVITVEEHQKIGGIGSAVAEVIADNSLQCKFVRMGFDDKFTVEYGWHKDILEQNGLGVGDIVRVVKDVCGR